VRVDAQSESRILMAEVLGQLIDGDASCQHDAGVIVTELMDSFSAGGDIAASAAPVHGGLGNQACLYECGFQIVSE
jgi:hypothetical protein